MMSGDAGGGQRGSSANVNRFRTPLRLNVHTDLLQRSTLEGMLRLKVKENVQGVWGGWINPGRECKTGARKRKKGRSIFIFKREHHRIKNKDTKSTKTTRMDGI